MLSFGALAGIKMKAGVPGMPYGGRGNLVWESGNFMGCFVVSGGVLWILSVAF
jgi:hypothetical protein